ncbi:hypothetical protein AAHA92_25082 [Salvia divinorum]|uniref:Uncharacterized protein n=1 Tax=Salvia divinorum TaxID=28513 RepID=A0ABD1G9L8_SALDI
MAEAHSEGGGEEGVGPSYSNSDGDLLSKMTQMITGLKNELRSDVKASEIRMQALHNTMLEEINAVKRNRSSRSSTPREASIPNVIPKAYNGEERYDGEQLGIGVVIGRMTVLGEKMEFMVVLVMRMG